MKFVILLFISLRCLAEDLTPDQVTQTKLIESENLKENLSITKYEQIYVAYGNPSTKAQLSFKYQMIETIPLYFGYTQVMIWNLNLDSAPFKDVNYAPEVFYRFDLKVKVLDSIDLSPYAHISNGRDGEFSRSIDRGYVRFNLRAPVSEGEIKISASIFGYYPLSKDNGDIHEYISPLDLKFTVTQFVPWVFDKGELYFRIFPGGSFAERWDRGGREVGLSFRLGGFGLNPSLFLQYSNGYAESLLGYRNQDRQFRIGILL